MIKSVNCTRPNQYVNCTRPNQYGYPSVYSILAQYTVAGLQTQIVLAISAVVKVCPVRVGLKTGIIFT